MISLVSLLVAATLVSQQYGFEANAQIDDPKLTMDNSLQPHVWHKTVLYCLVVAVPKRRLKKFVHIWTPPAEEVKRVEGERVQLECVAMGNPLPSVYWMRNGETIQDPAEEANEIIPRSTVGLAQITSKLIITSSSPGEDEYTCVAEAGVKRDVATSTVFTIPTQNDEADLLALQKLFLPTSPTITYAYNELFQELGSTVLLPCRVQSQSETEVVWQDKNERQITGSPRMRVLPSGDLLISSLRWSDMGFFSCIATNMYGQDAAKTFVYPVKP